MGRYVTTVKVLHTEASKGWGGQELRTLTEAQELEGRGHDVTIIAPGNSQIYKRAESLGIKVVQLGMTKSIGSLIRAVQVLKRQAPDVVNCHSSTDHWLFSIAAKLQGRAIKVIRTRHISVPTKDTLANRLLFNKLTDFTVTTGEHIRLALIQGLSINAEKIESVPTGIDLNYFSPRDKLLDRSLLSLPNEKLVLGLVATLRFGKGVQDLLHSLSLMTDAEKDRYLLVVVGDGPQMTNLKRLAQTLSLASMVRFVGNQIDVRPYLSAMDVFVLPTHAEGVPQALLQAMAMEKPIIATGVGGIPWVVEGYGAFFRIDQIQDPDAILKAIRIATLETKSFSLNVSNRPDFGQLFGADAMIARMLSIYQRLGLDVTKGDVLK